MPFIYEPIPEADKQRIDFEEQIKTVPQYPKVPHSWVIDRERNVYLVNYTMGGSQIDMPAIYGLGYKDLGVAWFESREKSDPKNAWGLVYEISNVFLKESLTTHKAEILSLIEEAIKAFALNSWAPRSITIEVNFSK